MLPVRFSSPDEKRTGRKIKQFKMKESKVVHQDKIVIEIKMIGEQSDKFCPVIAREKIVYVNDEVVYKEWQSWPQFQHKENTSVALENLERQLSFRKQSQSAKNSRSNRGNFVNRVKMVWAKLLAKVVNFKT